MPTIHKFIVQEQYADLRLDKYLVQQTEQLTRSYIQKLFARGKVLVNGCKAKASYKVKPGDKILLTEPKPVELEIEPEDIPLDIYYEDKDLMVVNKPRGMVVHPAEGNLSGTLVNALLNHCRDLSGIGGTLRPGIVHRLDKDTTGLLVVAKNDTTHLHLTLQLKNKTVTRRYLALVLNDIKTDHGVIDAPIGRDPKDRLRMTVIYKNSKPAVTYFTVKKRFSRCTLVECQLETGRTHQIRVHMAYIHHPVIGDIKYGEKSDYFKNINGQLLHAAVLGFNHPRTGEYFQFNAPLPADFQRVIDKLASENN